MSRKIISARKKGARKTNNIVNLLKGHEFIVQSGEATVATIYPVVESATLELAKHFLRDYTPLVCLVIHGHATYAMEKNQALEVGRYFLSAAEKGRALIIHNTWKNYFASFNRLCISLLNTKLPKLTNHQLTGLYAEFYRTYVKEYSLALITDGFGFLMDEYFPDIISKKIKNDKLVPQIVSELTNPAEKSFLEKEKEFLAFLAKKHKLHARKRNFAKAYDEYFQNYYWIKSSYARNRNLDLAYFKKELHKISLNASLKKNAKDKKIKDKIIGKYKLGKEIKTLVKLVEMTTLWQDLRKMANMKANYWLHILNGQIAKRLKLKLSDLEFLTPHEITSIFEDTKPLKSLPERKQKFGFIGTRTRVETIPRQKLYEVKSIITEPADLTQNVIRGNIASKGYARGIVKIIQSSSEISKITKGEIIVCSMTRPELMPAVKKAKAIITDEGGITCHAAIVSRELHIPCIIGTKIATKVLKDGDLVEFGLEDRIIKIIRK